MLSLSILFYVFIRTVHPHLNSRRRIHPAWLRNRHRTILKMDLRCPINHRLMVRLYPNWLLLHIIGRKNSGGWSLRLANHYWFRHWLSSFLNINPRIIVLENSIYYSWVFSCALFYLYSTTIGINDTFLVINHCDTFFKSCLDLVDVDWVDVKSNLVVLILFQLFRYFTLSLHRVG